MLSQKSEWRGLLAHFRPSHAQLVLLFAVATLCVLVGAIYTQIIFLNDKHFIPPLDDTYIHLRVAEMILQGSYGINLGEFSAPSSSIIWPFLLLPGVALNFGLAWAMLLNGIFVALAVALICWRISNVWDRRDPAYLLLFAIILTFALNGLDMVFLGMEHGLHLLLTIYVLDGIPRLVKRKQLPGVLWVLAVILLPLTRYEGLGLALLSIAAVGWIVGVVEALALLAAVILPAVCFSVFLYLHIGTWLPSSVMQKLAVNGSSEPLFVYLQKLSQMTSVRALLGSILIAVFAWKSSSKEVRWMLAFGVALIVGHLAIAQFGWFGRYETYLFGVPFITLAYAIPRPSTQILRSGLAVATSALLVIFGLGYALSIAGASNNIYQLHYRMHLLATKYFPGSVATHDIGLISYHNPGYILDLLGLAYDPARVAFIKQDRDFLKTAVADKNIRTIIIAESQFDFSDTSAWTRVGMLRVQGKLYLYPYRELTVFVRDRGDLAAAREALIKLAHEHDIWVYLYTDDGRHLLGMVSECNFNRYRKRVACNPRETSEGISSFGSAALPSAGILHVSSSVSSGLEPNPMKSGAMGADPVIAPGVTHPNTLTEETGSIH